MKRNYHQEHTNELNSLPESYPIEMAINNNDIVENHSDPYNTERFFEFLSNAEQGIPDKIRITRYGFDNPGLATKTILEYNGNIFIFTIASSQIPVTYYGGEIIYRYAQPGNWLQYFLRKFNDGEVLIFTLYNYK